MRLASTLFPNETIVAMNQPLKDHGAAYPASALPPAAEQELEIRRGNVRAIIFLGAAQDVRTYRVALLRHDAPFQLFPSELADYAFSLADLMHLRVVLDAAQAWIEWQRSNR